MKKKGFSGTIEAILRYYDEIGVRLYHAVQHVLKIYQWTWNSLVISVYIPRALVIRDYITKASVMSENIFKTSVKVITSLRRQ